jgi:anthranilate/para-aminobenzoate synthase component I
VNPTAQHSDWALPDLSGLKAHAPWLLLDASGAPGVISGYLAVGVKRSLTLEHPDADAFDRIAAFVGAGKGRCFGWVGYDQLRADPMLNLPPQAPVHVPLPAAHWVEAEGVLAFSGCGAEAHCEWFSRPEDASLAAAMEAAVRHPDPGMPSPIAGENSVDSSLNAEAYMDAFEKVHAHILRGDIYEMNLCRELRGFLPSGFSADAAFGDLVAKTLAPYSAHIQMGPVHIVSASPECFLERQGDRLISRPIKGTAPRHADPATDAKAAENLRTDVKERAENVMITDLVRNDLSRIAAPSTVEVEELCGIHSFRNVHQMVSTVSCVVQPGTRFSEILKATFPMGSMTGAPKLRAVEITAEIEPVMRGLYSGTLGWADPNGEGDVGDFHLNVVIRTAVADTETGRWSAHVGGAITALAQPLAEWKETQLKAKAVLEVLGGAEPVNRTENSAQPHG